MTTITLLPHAERRAPAGAVPGYAGRGPLLYHQARTYDALAAGAPLVLNSYPTGAGKTIAALLRLLHPAQRGGNTLIIAPTNALLDQQAADARDFIAAHGLPVDVVPFHADTLRGLAPELRRPGEKAQRLLENPLTFWEGLGLPPDAQRRPFVAVTNPDIFYYALYFQYGPHDRRNMFERFISRFTYVVIDEFHYYDAKQFANFLFFFALWKRWGYFAHGRTICLLSATPRENVRHYLSRVFDTPAWVEISPDNEPPAAAALPEEPSLSELRLQLLPGSIEEWAQENRAMVEGWVGAGLDTVLISSSLVRVNSMAQILRHLDPVRITGPEPQAERRRVGGLTLATPTVDIGYNFGRPGKGRQSIDRLVADARFGDELTQRIGRAGRVLGRAETAVPSEATVLLSDEAAQALAPYDGQRLTRRAWARIVEGCTALPPRHRLDGYIRSQAIAESFYPISQIGKAASIDTPLADELFEAVRAVFAPNTRQSPCTLHMVCRRYDERRIWLRKAASAQWSPAGRDGDDLAQHFADYVGWLKSRRGARVTHTKDQVRPHLQRLLLSQPEQRAALHDFIAQQVALTGAIFSFRDAWQGPPAAVADPQRIFSSQPVSRYDILHLYTGYRLRLLDRDSFTRSYGPVEEARLYAEIVGLRDERLRIGLRYSSPLSEPEFRERHCRAVTALRGLRLSAQAPDGSPLTVEAPIRACIEEDWVPGLVVHQESWYPLFAAVCDTPFYPRALEIDFPDGSTQPYQIITGIAAFHILPELNGHFHMLDRQLDDESIWC